jgi:hypothetical protein
MWKETLKREVFMSEWLAKQIENAKVAWTVVVVVLGMLGYQVVKVAPTPAPTSNQPVVNAPANPGK